HCLVAPVLNGWIGIYPENNGQDQTIGQQISQQLPEDPVLHLLVHDDDIFAYWLYRAGMQIDSYWSTPGYFGEENRAQEEKMTGNPETFRPIIGDTVTRLAALLARDAALPAFASERLAAFARVLNIPNAV